MQKWSVEEAEEGMGQVAGVKKHKDEQGKHGFIDEWDR